ncbi:NADP-dependent malic enzyme [Oscillospiraceae bacterium MB08-C2-2]|nr:NADP-dependent malic enzyme [Oscillospiraceae bacterium MB08-C2-2]
MTNQEKALELHKQWRGKIRVEPNCPMGTREELALAYTPGVAEPCKLISKEPELSYLYTRRWNTVAVVTDGTAVLGLGDIGPEAGMPVMEGKCALFSAFGGIDAIPLCVRSKEVEDIVKTVTLLAGSFGGINLEDISAPRCFEIERRLKESCDIPIFHDDQHGTAVVVVAAVFNALKLVKKEIGQIRVVVSGAGAAGMAVASLLMEVGVRHLAMADIHGPLYKGRVNMDAFQKEMAEVTNMEGITGALADLMVGADLFVGVSAPNLVTAEMVRSMNRDPIIFAMANPVPEIDYDLAKENGVAVMGTGRSDYPNQINNVLAFPGIFRGVLDARAKEVNDEMKIAAAKAIADLVSDEELSPEFIIPSALDPKVAPAVAAAVAKAAAESGTARI